MKFPQQSLGWALIVFSIVLVILISLIKADHDQQGAFLCSAVAANPAMDMSSCPVHTSNISWFIVGAYVVAAIVFACGVGLLLFPRVSSSTSPEKVVDISKLDSDENKVYEILKSAGGSFWQAKLVDATGFGKVKVTRVVDKLEVKGIVERRRRGMTNLIVLK